MITIFKVLNHQCYCFYIESVSTASWVEEEESEIVGIAMGIEPKRFIKNFRSSSPLCSSTTNALSMRCSRDVKAE